MQGSFPNPSLHGKLGFVKVAVHVLLSLGLEFAFYCTLHPKYKVEKEIPYFYFLHFIQGLRKKKYSFVVVGFV